MNNALRCVFVALFAGAYFLSAQDEEKPQYFRYDAAEHEVEGRILEGETWYDADVVVTEEGTLVAWLEFVPGEGDHLWLGLRRGAEWVERARVSESAGRRARPTLTRTTDGATWLSYEEQGEDGFWDVFTRRRGADETELAAPRRASKSLGNNVSHAATADEDGGVWLAWQCDRRGQFDVVARQIAGDPAKDGGETPIGSPPFGDWHPSVAVTQDGDVCVVWDGYNGTSYDVFARWRIGGRWRPPVVVAGSRAFEARAQVAVDGRGRMWTVWEEGELAWGDDYRGNDKIWNNVTDDYGPLHRFRKQRVALLHPDGSVAEIDEAFPMPAFATVQNADNRRENVKELGAFYERAELCVDGRDRPWIVYRHYYELQLGADEPVVHHIENGWRVSGRYLSDAGWSELYAFDVEQRDGVQRLSVAPVADGISAIWSTGRTDRRKDDRGRGLVTGSFTAAEGTAPEPKTTEFETVLRRSDPAVLRSAAVRPKPAEVGGESYRVYFGDLHRHTDLSLCFPFYDGSLNDAYRYAIDVGRLDFLGITDHTRDIAKGDALSQLWWRSTKEVTRHALGEAFVPYFAYERSHRDTDHNVVSLREDVLRNFPPPLPEFWEEIGRDTFTIPHNPFIGEVWEYQDDEKRPLLEIFQGFRDQDSQEHAHTGLGKGYHLGFIASSDHLSTSTSYACVWSPRGGREPIFRSMQARRTYGATAKIRLVFRTGEHWMGEQVQTTDKPVFQLEVDGTAPIERVELVRDGEVLDTFTPDGETPSAKHVFDGRAETEGEHYYYVHVIQTDGNRAWSSPIWIRP